MIPHVIVLEKKQTSFNSGGGEVGLYDRKSDPGDHTDWSTDYMLYETYCTRGIDQIQAF